MLARSKSILPGLALLGATLLAPALKADEFEKKTIVHVLEPLQLPNKVLEPGQYVFRLMDNPDRHIVLIYTADGSRLVVKVLAVPNLRLTPTAKTVFQFWETPAGQPKALRAWFYPGDNFGQEFVYPKAKSAEIAKIVHAPVLAVVAEKEVEIETAPIVRVDEKGVETPVAKEELIVAKNEPPAAVEPQAVPAPAALPAPPAPQTLPDTSSTDPLIGLIGLASLAAFGLMSRLSSRA